MPRELVDVVGQHAVEPIPPTGAVDDELAHVRNIEDADIVPPLPDVPPMMLVYCTGISQAPKWNHLRAKPHVLVVKRCLFYVRLATGQA